MEKIYSMEFMATETLQNGSEKRCKRTVYAPVFRTVNGHKIHFGEEERISAAYEELRQNHYYNIEYIGTKCKSIMTIGGKHEIN